MKINFKNWFNFNDKHKRLKAIYSLFWLVTFILLITLIVMFVAKKNVYDYKDKKNGSFSRYVEIKKRVPEEVIIANDLDKEDNYYLQAIQNYDVDHNGTVSEPDRDTMQGDIVANMFYPLSYVRQVPQLDAFGNDIFDFRYFNAEGYGKWQTVVQNKIQINGFTYFPGMKIDLIDIYNNPNYNPQKDLAASDSFLKNFNLEILSLKKETKIPSTESYGTIKGEYAYDVEREKLDNVPGEQPLALLKPNNDAIKVISTITNLGLVFFISLSISIISTVAISIYLKRQKENNYD